MIFNQPGMVNSTVSLAKPSAVNFYDYDGTLVASYSGVPSSLPANPSHNGLVAQGWNYTLAEIQAQFNAVGACDVGQMYMTASNDTEIDIVLKDGRLSPYIALGSNGVIGVDWGDGTTSTISSSSQYSTKHDYAAPGAYTIKLHVNSGNFTIGGQSTYPLLHNYSGDANKNQVYASCVRAVRLGKFVTLGTYAFSKCFNLASVSMTTDSVTPQLPTYAFDGCRSLKYLTIPSKATGINTYAFRNCYSMKAVSIPKRVTALTGYSFQSCMSLSSVATPYGVLTIGTNAFQYCYSLSNLIIPPNLTSLGNYAVGSCYSLKSFNVPYGITTIMNNVFESCYGIESITLPSSVTSVTNYAFQNCQSLTSVNIPNGITSIYTYVFRNCYSLSTITIPSSVTSISANAFNGCSGLAEIHMKPSTPPTVANANAFTGIPTDCIIYVPTGSLSAYTSASNYPSSSTYTYIEE